MYYMYIRVVDRGAFSRSLSQSDGFNKYNSEILRQSPFVLPSCITYTLGGFAKEFFLVFHLKSVGGKTQIKLPPFLTCLDFGVCRAIRLVRFGYNTFTGCVA